MRFALGIGILAQHYMVLVSSELCEIRGRDAPLLEFV